MSSSLIDSAAPSGVAVVPGAAAVVAGAAVAPADLDIRQRSWIKRLLPQTMFGRSLLLIVLPLVLVQIIATWVFYARHWEIVSRRLSADTAGDIGMVIDGLRSVDTPIELTRWL